MSGQAIKHRFNIDRLQIGFWLPTSQLNGIEYGFATNCIKARKPLKGYGERKVLNLYYIFNDTVLFGDNGVYIGQLFWYGDEVGDCRVYVTYANEVLYDSRLSEYMKAVHNAVVERGGRFSHISRLDIAYDTNLNLMQRFERLTQRREPAVLLKGKPKECKFKINGRVVRRVWDTTPNFYAYPNRYDTNKTVYVKGCYTKGKEQMFLRIYNKTKEVCDNGNKKAYVLAWFGNQRNHIYRLEVSFKKTNVIKATIEKALGCNAYPTNNNYIGFIVNAYNLQVLFEEASRRIFSTTVTVNRTAVGYGFTELVERDMVIMP